MLVFVVLMPKHFGPGIHIIPIGVTPRINRYNFFFISCKLCPNCLGCKTFNIWIVKWVFNKGSFGSLKCLIDVATYPSTGVRAKSQINGPKRSSPREQTSGVATNVYSRKTLEKPKKGL